MKKQTFLGLLHTLDNHVDVKRHDFINDKTFAGIPKRAKTMKYIEYRVYLQHSKLFS